jgi:hypothetical protein
VPRRPVLSQAAKDALPYWGEIRNAAANHLTTQQLWQSIRFAQERLGSQGYGPTLLGVSELRGRAGAIQRAADELAAASPRKNLTGRYVTQAPWARSTAVQRVDPKYQATFAHQSLKDGEQVTTWRSVIFSGQLPPTIGAFQQAIDEDAIALADDYDEEHVGVSDIQLLAI